MNKFKYTVIGQMLDVLRAHFVSALLLSFIWITLIAVWSTQVGGYVFTALALVSYFLTIYSCGERAAKNDKKPYADGVQDIRKCLYIPLLLILVNLVFAGIYKFTWVFGSDGNAISEVWSVITNILSFAWFSVYGSLAGMDKGNLSVIGIACIIVLPILSYFPGYLAGIKGFDINEAVFGFMYEKKKK